MAKITDLDAGYYRIPLEHTLSDSMHGLIPNFELNTVRVRDADGVEGMGYTYTVGRNGVAIHALLEREFKALAIGEDANRIEALWQKFWWALHYGGRGGPTVLALSAVDIALWDLKARRANMPLWELLGGYNPCVPCYAGGVDLDYTLDKLLEQTDANLKKGFRAIKMKVGRKNLGEDVARLKVMREHLGEEFPLMVDANMKWSADQAIRAAREFAAYKPLWLEEPLIPDDFAGQARVVREGGLPIAAGENFRTIWEFKQLIECGGVTYPEPDVTNCGGVTSFMKIAHLAESFNLPVTSHGAHDITVQCLASVPNCAYLEAHGFGLDRYIAQPLAIENGCAIAPSRPGHGIEFDWQALDKLKA
jgi:L-alanine-DL-glutamate epimerase-like enolase superfamily enzyme